MHLFAVQMLAADSLIYDCIPFKAVTFYVTVHSVNLDPMAHFTFRDDRIKQH